MAKFFGMIGIGEEKEVSPGIWKYVIEEQSIRGDIARLSRRYQSAQQVNDNISLNMELSFIADSLVRENIFSSIKYVKYRGVAWKVTSIDDLSYPRLKLTLGEVYNGEQANTA